MTLRTVCAGCNYGLPLRSDGTHPCGTIAGTSMLTPCAIVARIRETREREGWTFRQVCTDNDDRIQSAARLTALGLTPYIIATDGTYRKPQFVTEPPIWVLFTAERRPIPETEPTREVMLDRFAQELFDRNYGDLDPVERRAVDGRILHLGSLVTGGSGQSTRMEVHAISTMPLVGALARQRRFVAVGKAVMDGADCVGTMRSKNFAKRTARALNRHKINSEGV